MRRFRTVVVVSMLVAVTMGPVGPVSAAPPKPVITVPAGDVDALYAAVYDDDDSSRSNVVIQLTPSTYELDKTKGPNEDGRLVLGDGTELVSTLELQLDAHGVPTGTEIYSGAVIDTGDLDFSFIGVGAVVLGKGGRISGLTVTNSTAPLVIAIDMPFGGSVHHVISENSFQGVRISAGAQDVRGSVSESVLRDNFLAGVTVVQVDVLAGPGVNNATIRANIDRNRIEGQGSQVGFAGVFVLGAFDGSNNRTQLSSSHNVIGSYPIGIRLSHTDNGNNPMGTDNNTTRLTSTDDTLAGNFIGLEVLGAFREAWSESTSDGNRATAHMIRTEFSSNFFADIAANGSLSDFPDDTVGVNNLAEVILSNTNPPFGDLTILADGCLDNVFLPIEPCPNEARIVPQ